VVRHALCLADAPRRDARARAARLPLRLRRARRGGAALVGIFHDAEVREAVATRAFDMSAHAATHTTEAVVA
jgi:alpha-D-ribose 1-methylphosphonate 5-triphosphate synthase subunit PhnL